MAAAAVRIVGAEVEDMSPAAAVVTAAAVVDTAVAVDTEVATKSSLNFVIRTPSRFWTAFLFSTDRRINGSHPLRAPDLACPASALPAPAAAPAGAGIGRGPCLRAPRS